MPPGAAAQFARTPPAGPVVRTPHVRAELLAHAPQGLAPGAVVWLGLKISHQPGWHTYWKNAGDSGLPTELRWTLPAGLTAGDVDWPTPRRIPIGSLANYGYEDTVLLPVPLTVAPGFSPALPTVPVKLSAAWLVCRQECIPEEGEFTLALPAHGSIAAPGGEFEAALAARPAALPE
ncbi:MAG: protein-disulfide reductase DsbD family protein, partial [Xenophilus sp.]